MNRSELSSIEKKVAQAVDNFFSGRGEVCFVLGVSGGIDSTCLLHIFAKLQVKVIAVHINYKTRGEASEKDAEFVKNVCKKLNITSRLFEVDYQKASYSNFQAWAREIRYDYFEKVANEINAAGIATAHNEDDQIETILQKIFRGGGLESWRAMQIWNGLLFRPLLNISRDEIKDYSKERNISFREDRSNRENKYARNFLRNEWLPKLTKHFPGWRGNIKQAARQAEIFGNALEYILSDITKDEKTIQRKAFFKLSAPLQKSLLLRLIKKKFPDISLSKNALAELRTLKNLQTGKKIQLSEQLFLVRDRQFLMLQRDSNQPKKEYLLNQKDLEGGGGVQRGNLFFFVQPFEEPDYHSALHLDIQKLQWPLQLRPWRAGDRFQPLGMNGHQNVADHLTNRKISAGEKAKAMVLKDFDERIAAVIFPPGNKGAPGTISDFFKCSASTQKTLMIKPKT